MDRSFSWKATMNLDTFVAEDAESSVLEAWGNTVFSNTDHSEHCERENKKERQAFSAKHHKVSKAEPPEATDRTSQPT